MPDKISVVVPLYNEAQNVAPLTEKVKAAFGSLPGYEHECLLVNDGSTDGTREAIDGAAAVDTRFRAVHLESNFGQSAAIWAGMQRSTGEYVLTIDGDLQNDPADFPAIVELLKEYDCVCGYRENRRDSWLRKVYSRLANAVRNAVLRDGLRDAGCGTKGFRRHCLDYMIPFNGLHRFFGALMRNAGMSIIECPVGHHPRVHGESKYGIQNRLWRSIFDLVGVLWLRRRFVHPVIEAE